VVLKGCFETSASPSSLPGTIGRPLNFFAMSNSPVNYAREQF
jgi:hypothetical protein